MSSAFRSGPTAATSLPSGETANPGRRPRSLPGERSGISPVDAEDVEAQVAVRLAAGEEDSAAVREPRRGLLGADRAGAQLPVISGPRRKQDEGGLRDRHHGEGPLSVRGHRERVPLAEPYDRRASDFRRKTV